MFLGFKLTLDDNDFDFDIEHNYYNIGNSIFKQNKKVIKEELDSFINKDGSIDGSKLQEKWFPQIKSDVFISHSHQDEKSAIILAGWLNKVFGLNVFIDSSVWGYSNDLLKIIDDRYCRNGDCGNYDYNKRNFSTSHVHMMLSSALSSMMDRTEALFFLNTPNSNTVIDLMDKTKSPWIYSEIEISKLIRRKKDRTILKGPTFTSEMRKVLNESVETLDMNYDLDLDHLIHLDTQGLKAWEEEYKKYAKYIQGIFSEGLEKPFALDVLYKQNYRF